MRDRMIVAGIDCGTNSVRLLVAEGGGTDLGDLHHPHDLHDLHREMRIVRLGQDVDRTGRLAPEALERTRAALIDYAATIEAFGAHRVRMIATSATRDATNRAEFVAMVRDVLGVEPEVVSGVDEAALSFAGASSVLATHDRPLLVADIGGGSTELVRGGDGPLRAHSMDVGAVRMTERHLHDDPPTTEQVAAAVADVAEAVRAARASVELDPAVTMIGVAGTVTTVAALALGLDRYDPDVLDGAQLDVAQVHDVTDRLVGMSLAQRSQLGAIHPGRRDVIVGGALVLRTLVDELDVPGLTVSEHDILDGIVLGLT